MAHASEFSRYSADKPTGLLFLRVYNAWHTQMKAALRRLDLTHAQFAVIATLGYLSRQEDSITQTRLARQADMDTMTLSQVLGGLEKKGYVQRTPSPADSRANVVRLLPAGQQALCGALPVAQAIDSGFFCVLPHEEEAFFRSALLSLLDGCEAPPQTQEK